MDEKIKCEVMGIVPPRIRVRLCGIGKGLDCMTELRFRIGQPPIIRCRETEIVMNDLLCTRRDLDETIELVCRHSVYAYEGEIRNGFVTVEGGHRVGLAGKTVVEDGCIKTMRNISFINIRIAHEVKGCADGLWEYIHLGEAVENTLIVSPPGCGKTTMIRELARLMSYGDEKYAGINVGIVDERHELAACHNGCPQNDLGPRTDVLDGCPKSIGLTMLVRSMCPDAIVVDEIATEEDVNAIEYSIKCGCAIIATAHGKNYDELLARPALKGLLEGRAFKCVIVLGKSGGIGTVVERRRW